MASKKKVAKLHVKKGDMVVLTKRITSSKNIQADREAGYQGKILKVFPETGRVIVEGVNLRYRHTKPNQLYPEGGRIEREASIHASNVMPIDSSGQRTRIGRRLIVDNDTGQRRWMRYAKTDGQELDS